RAADIVNSWAEKDLRRVFAEYGEEPEAARVAGAIVRRRVKTPFEVADDLGRFVAGVKTRRPRGIDPATRVFQALRIAVNDELANLEHGLAAARAGRPFQPSSPAASAWRASSSSFASSRKRRRSRPRATKRSVSRRSVPRSAGKARFSPSRAPASIRPHVSKRKRSASGSSALR